MVSGQAWYTGSFAVVRSPALAVVLLFAGCTMLPVADYQALKSQNQSLAERNRAQAVQQENLQVHTRNTEDKLMRAEQDLAARRRTRARRRLAESAGSACDHNPLSG